MGVSISYYDAPQYERKQECLCVDGDEQDSCNWCHGTGVYVATECDYDLHVCYSTLGGIFDAIGLGHLDEVCGELEPQVLIDALAGHRAVDYGNTLLRIATAARAAGKKLNWC